MPFYHSSKPQCFPSLTLPVLLHRDTHFGTHERVTSCTYLLNSDFSHFHHRDRTEGTTLPSCHYSNCPHPFLPPAPFTLFSSSLLHVICFPEFQQCSSWSGTCLTHTCYVKECFLSFICNTLYLSKQGLIECATRTIMFKQKATWRPRSTWPNLDNWESDSAKKNLFIYFNHE